jgi:hypothetical protein
MMTCFKVKNDFFVCFLINVSFIYLAGFFFIKLCGCLSSPIPRSSLIANLLTAGTGKKKGKGRRGEDNEDESQEFEEKPDAEDVGVDDSAEMSDLVEKIAEKRGETRKRALRELNAKLACGFHAEFLASRSETLMEYLSNCVKKGDAEEVALASRSAALTVVGVEGDENTAAFYIALLSAVSADVAAPPLARAAALSSQALAIVCSGSCSNPDLMHAALRLCAQLFDRRAARQVEAPLVAAAVGAWALLATSLGHADVWVVALPAFPSILALMGHPDLTVRLSCGEAVAVVLSAYNRLDDEAQREAKLQGLNVAAVTESLQGLATDASKRKSKVWGEGATMCCV